jgi:hypothetical protein
MALFTLTADILAIGQEAFDTLINQLGKPCKIYLKSQGPTVCPNCIFNSSTNKSSGKYNGTGPISFSGGLCPICHGLGFLPNTTETTTNVTLLIEWNPKTYKITDAVIKEPMNIIYTKGYVSDLPYILQAESLVIDFANANYENNRYELWGEPAIPGNIIKNRYFECYWKRRGS